MKNPEIGYVPQALTEAEKKAGAKMKWKIQDKSGEEEVTQYETFDF